MTRILGIDPGSRATGFGVVAVTGARLVHLTSGTVVLDEPELSDRLAPIYEAIRRVIEEHAPQAAAIERVFMHRNADSALKLGHARGVAILAAVQAGLPVAEYAPRAVKQAVVGRGGADKRQVQHMVRVLLGLAEPPAADAADALAVALCHGHTLQSLGRSGTAAMGGWRR